jgi:alpha-N-arabinofuranosidase
MAGKGKARGGRTFNNPILPGFHPDPSICRVGDDFYLVNSSFEYFPGVPIFHSRDLVHWRQIGHVLTRRSQLNLDKMGSSRGIYAPTLRHAGGRFYMITTLIDGGGNFVVSARRPEGSWSDPIWLDQEGESGFDPSLLFHDGRVYYTRTGKGADFEHPFVHQVELDLGTFKRRGRMRVIWRGTGDVWTEGPHLLTFSGKNPGRVLSNSRVESRRAKLAGTHAIRGRYYLLAAEGGTFLGHAQMAARSEAPFGPFEPCPRNPILSHRRRRGHPIQATGHADLVTLCDGSVWAVFLGVRRHDGHTLLGRESYLAPVTFDNDGWPMIGDGGHVELKMVAPALPAHSWPGEPARDDFDDLALAPHWVFLRNPVPGAASLKERPGFLRLWGSPETLDDVAATTFVGRRQEHHAFTCQTELDFSPQRPGEEAGLTVRAREEFHLDLAIRWTADGREAVATVRAGKNRRTLGRVQLPGQGRVRLEISATAAAYRFRAGTGNRLRLLGTVPTRMLSTETIKRSGILHFTGVVIGMYATGRGQRASVPADFDWFSYRGR